MINSHCFMIYASKWDIATEPAGKISLSEYGKGLLNSHYSDRVGEGLSLSHNTSLIIVGWSSEYCGNIVRYCVRLCDVKSFHGLEEVVRLGRSSTG
jgi:hypothetical protein